MLNKFNLKKNQGPEILKIALNIMQEQIVSFFKIFFEFEDLKFDSIFAPQYVLTEFLK